MIKSEREWKKTHTHTSAEWYVYLSCKVIDVIK